MWTLKQRVRAVVGWIAWVAAACMAFAPESVLASDLEDQPQLGLNQDDMFVMLLKVILVLIVIIGFFLLIVKILAQKNRAWMSGRSIRLIGGIGLGPQKSMQVVKVGPSLYVVGIGNEVRLLDKIDDPEQVEAVLDALAGDGASSPGVPILSRLFNRSRSQEEETREQSAASFQQLFMDRMQQVSKRKSKLEEWMKEDRKP